MKKIYLSILLILLANSIYSQTIEVLVTDTIMCKVESSDYMLTVNFPWVSRSRKRKEFQNNLTSSNYTYESFYEKIIVDVREDYVTAKYRITFKNLKEKLDFDLKMNLEKQLHSLELVELRIEYEEKEKIRLVEKLIGKGVKKAKLIAEGLGKELLDIKQVSDAVDPRLTNEVLDDEVLGNSRVSKRKEPNMRDEAEKIKSLVITFNTK